MSDHLESSNITTMEYVPVQRKIRLPCTTEAVSYIEPPHIMFCSGNDVTPEEMITTAICWTLATRPKMIPERQVDMTPELQEAVEIVTSNILFDQILVFLGMAGLMTLAKKVRFGVDANHEYLTKRWQAVCSTVGIESIFESRVVSQKQFRTFVKILKFWQDWIAPRPALRRSLFDAALKLPKESFSETPFLVRTVISQVREELLYFDLDFVLMMDAFVSSQNEAIFLRPIAQQTADFRRAMDELRTTYGDRFPYLKIYSFEGVDRLNYRLYPDLFYATVISAVANKIIAPDTAKYILMDVQTRTARHIINKGLENQLKTEMLDEATIASLRFLSIEPRLSCRRREENDDEDKDEKNDEEDDDEDEKLAFESEGPRDIN